MKEWTGILPLAAQAKLLDDRLVTFQIRLLEVIKELSPTGCHHQQAATGMEILAVRFQVFRKMSDTGGEQGDLHFLDPVSLSWERFSSIMFCLFTCSDMSFHEFLDTWNRGC